MSIEDHDIVSDRMWWELSCSLKDVLEHCVLDSKDKIILTAMLQIVSEYYMKEFL